MGMLSMLDGNAVAFAPQSSVSQSRVSAMEMKQNPVIIGVAADSGCGKSTFMRRLTSIFGGESKMLDIGRETNTLISEMTTVICLDDYHKWDRTGRASNPEYPNGITALDEKCQDWDKMAADVTDLKAGKTVSKPIYNHITGELDPYEEVPATPIVIFEGLHPLYDSRVNAALDLSIYLDITDEVKFAWKAQRDIAERGATMEDVQKAIDARKPDFKAYVEPQKEKADIVIQVLMSDVVPDGSGKFPQGQVHPEEGLRAARVRLPDGRGLGRLMDAELGEAGERGGRQAGIVLGGLVRQRGLRRRDGRCRRQARGDHLPGVPAVQHGHQVLRRAHGADRQEQGRARLGQRHRPHADSVLLQDP